jgi:hypothetical protein
VTAEESAMSDIEIPYEDVRDVVEATSLAEVGPHGEFGPEASEADAVDQLLSVDLDEDDYR